MTTRSYEAGRSISKPGTQPTSARGAASSTTRDGTKHLCVVNGASLLRSSGAGFTELGRPERIKAIVHRSWSSSRRPTQPAWGKNYGDRVFWHRYWTDRRSRVGENGCDHDREARVF